MVRRCARRSCRLVNYLKESLSLVRSSYVLSGGKNGRNDFFFSSFFWDFFDFRVRVRDLD